MVWPCERFGRHTRCRKTTTIIAGGFKAEFGPRIGCERQNVGQYTVTESNNRGDWLESWLMTHNHFALDTMFRKKTGIVNDWKSRHHLACSSAERLRQTTQLTWEVVTDQSQRSSDFQAQRRVTPKLENAQNRALVS